MNVTVMFMQTRNGKEQVETGIAFHYRESLAQSGSIRNLGSFQANSIIQEHVKFL